MDNNKVEKNHIWVYSSLVKPPHCNVRAEKTDAKYGKLINIITPNYAVLFIEAAILSALLGFVLYKSFNGQTDDYTISFSTPKGLLPLIPFVIILGCVLYLVRLMTRRVKLYEKGLVICGIGRKEYFYSEIRDIQQSYESQRTKNMYTKLPYSVKRMIYIIFLRSGKQITLKRRHYLFLKSKMDDLKINLIET